MFRQGVGNFKINRKFPTLTWDQNLVELRSWIKNSDMLSSQVSTTGVEVINYIFQYTSKARNRILHIKNIKIPRRYVTDETCECNLLVGICGDTFSYTLMQAHQNLLVKPRGMTRWLGLCPT